MQRSSRIRLLLLAALLTPVSGCLFRSHPVASRISNAPLKSATRDELVARINSQAAKIHTLNATVDIDTSVGGQIKGKVTEYQQIRGYILVRKPDMLRMIGLFPLVRNRAFDMVSNGQFFRLSIPAKNRFIIGRNDVIFPSKQPLENLRPQVIFDSLMLREIDPRDEIAVLENATRQVTDPKTHRQLDEPDYVLIILRRIDDNWYLSRKIIFDRKDLEPDRQLIYDRNGYVASDVTYSSFSDHSGLMFPDYIHIWRPQEEYSIGLHFLKLQVNQPLTDEQFVLNQPPGAQVVRLDVAPGKQPEGAPPGGAAAAEPSSPPGKSQ
jgi:outer membrane lipoprotein-sorting protein